MGYWVQGIKNYFNFKGTLARKDYWMFVLVNFIILLCCGLLDQLFKLNVSGEYGGIFYGIFTLFSFIPSLSASVRRIHDIGGSGWIMIFFFLPLPVFFLLTLLPGAETLLLFLPIIWLAFGIYCVVQLAKPGINQKKAAEKGSL